MTQDLHAEPVRVLMVAIGGYGRHYLEALLNEAPAGRAQLAGVVDPLATRSAAWPMVSALGVPVVDTVDAYFAAGHRADLTVVASPPHLHVPHAIAALAGASHVLCDKPLGATIPDVDRLVDARDRAGRFVMIGYQWSFSAAIQALKRDLLGGRYGRPLRFATVCAWPRDRAYYRRNSWAGRIRDAESGAWVLDTPANNAMAHFLHNAFFLLGPTLTQSAVPVAVAAELARAYPIESADTTACRALTDGGCDVLFLASHVTDRAIEPMFRIECENGIIDLGESGQSVQGTTRDGRLADYGDPAATPQFEKLLVAIERVRHPGGVPCGIESAAAQTACAIAMHESAVEIAPFPALLRRGAPEEAVHVRGLADQLLRCYRSWVLPSEIGCPWAVTGRRVLPTLPACFVDAGPTLGSLASRSQP